MKPNKTIIFKSAWGLTKINGMSFSEALKLSWKAFKNNVRIIVTESWNKIKSVAFTKNGSTSGNIENVISAVIIVVDNSGAIHDYGIGLNNGD